MQRKQGARNPLRPARILCAKPFMLVEVAGNRAPGAEIGVERVAGARLDDANEGAAEHDLPWFEGDVVGGEFVGKPGDAVGRVAEDRGGDARLLDLAVAETQRGDPTQIGLVRFERPTAGDEP